MAVMKMLALTLIGPQAEMEPVAKDMVLTGGFQPLPLDMLINDRNLRSKVTTETANPYDELLTKISVIWKTAGSPLPEPEAVTIPKDFTLTAARLRVDTETDKLAVWQKRRLALINEEEGLEAAKVLLTALNKTKFKPADLQSSEFLDASFGRMSIDNYKRLRDSDEQSVSVNLLTEKDENAWLLILTPGMKLQESKKLLDTLGFVKFEIPSIEKLMQENADMYSIVSTMLDKHKNAIERLEKAAYDLIETNRAQFEQFYSQLYTMQRVYEVCKGRGEVSGMFILSGWIPADTLAEIKGKIEQEAPTTSILIDQTKELDISVPTLLKNSKFFSAFQDIVAMYSLPSYGELDPSPFVAFTFTLFFGFMFGDIGHGLAIYIAAVYALKKGIIKRSFAFVMKCASVSSMLFGLLYGSIFGQEYIIPALWLSPMHDTNTLIAVSIGLGFAIISIGMILNMIKQYRAKNFGGMLFDGQGLAGLALYWSMAALAMVYMTGLKISETAVNILWTGIAVLMLLMIFKDILARVLLRENKNGSMVMNVFGIVENLLSFLSNTASFVRLAAFALNHVGLSMAVIMLSDMVHNLPGGVVMKGIVLIIGNLVIVGLEGLIVFIQTLRLEYYEFFGKFYKGGGKEFRPIQWKN